MEMTLPTEYKSFITFLLLLVFLYILLLYGLYSLITPIFPFKSNTCFLIIGSAKGLGYEIVYQLSNLGYNLKFILIDILPCNNLSIISNKVVNKLSGHTVKYYKADLRNPAELEPIIDNVLSNSIPDILICDAAKINAKPIKDLSLKEIQETFNVNTISHACIISKVLNIMCRRNSGHIVTIASIASFISGANNGDYAGSKFALRGWHEAMRMEIKKSGKNGVHTTIVHPYIINTTLFKGVSHRLSLYFFIHKIV